jgi:hypothetical protein
MPGHLSPALRQQLEVAGVWRQFKALRNALRNGGMPARQANAKALGELLPSGQAPLPPMPPELASRRGTEADVVRWVARNLDNPEPDAATCPDGSAWAILRQCRENPAFRLEFIGAMWSRLLPAGAQRAEPEEKPKDARPTPELLARVRAMGTAGGKR